KILNDFNGKTVTYHGEPCVHYRFESQVQRCPDAMAVIGDNHSLSYAELNAKANQLAHYLRESGVARGDLVGIYAQRSPEFLVAILAIMKAGGAYIPFDPVNPISRIDYMLTDSGVSVLLTENELLEHLKDNLETPLACKALRLDCDLSSLETYSTENPVWCNESDDLAYMIYTSGSTGQPKGALVHHAGALNHIDAEFDV
ncbi:AMP-binding protein, partial [Vibrio azureus]